MRRILVTGGEGMIGKELRDLLHDQEEKGEQLDITILDIKNEDDIRDFEVCKALCEDMDEVYHLFGVKGSPKMTNERPVDFMLPMLQGDVNMIRAAHERGVKKFLYTSSIAVENPVDDKYPAWAKQTAETLIEAMRIQYPNGTKWAIVRPANVYGKYDNFENPNAMVITSLISKAINQDSLDVWGDGTQIRDFIHAKDVARGMIKAMEEMPDYPVNLCSGQGITIFTLARIISQEFNKEIVWDKDKPTGTQVRVMKPNWPAFQPEIDIEDGLKEVCEYVRTIENN